MEIKVSIGFFSKQVYKHFTSNISFVNFIHLLIYSQKKSDTAHC